MKGNCIIAQSGGPTAVINNSLVGVIEAAYLSNFIGEVYGSRNGILGILKQDLINFCQVSMPVIKGLRNTPGAALGSCRYKLRDETDYENILNVFRNLNIRYFFYIGGNDSMDTAHKVNQVAIEKGYELQVIGIPKTIDNDLPHTDHCPGYGSAAKYLATSVLEMGIDIKSIANSTKVVIVETMGRNTGWLAASTALARRHPEDAPHLIYLPEVSFNMEKFLIDVETAHKKHDTIVIVVAEGLRDANGNHILADGSNVDSFGHQRLGGLSQFLLYQIEDKLNIKGRYILLGTSQRSAMHLASRVDAEEAYAAGKMAVEACLREATDMMVSIKRLEKREYESVFELIDLSKVANREKTIPVDWINEEKNNVNDAFIEYARPLIQGEVNLEYHNGIPVYTTLS